MNKYIDTTSIAIIFSIGAFAISAICLYTMTKNQDRPKPKPKNDDEPLSLIRQDFVEEAKKERQHRLKQRKKYGIFDENGKRIKRDRRKSN